MTIVWCAPVERQLFCSPSRIQLVATLVSIRCCIALRCLLLHQDVNFTSALREMVVVISFCGQIHHQMVVVLQVIL